MEDSKVMQNKILWIILGAGVLVLAGIIFALTVFNPKNYRLTLVDAPSQVPASGVATFTWRIDGPPTTINHTAVHFGTVSTPQELGEEVAPESTNYTDLVTDFVSGAFDIPLQFISNAPVATAGSYFFRVHALIDDKHLWTDEYTFEVTPATHAISLVNAPSQVTAGQIATFTWNVSGPPTTINHTAVYFGTVSTPGELGEEVALEDTNYTDLVSDFVAGQYNIPLQFVGNLRIATAAATGTYYFRGHAVINDENFWTDQGTFEVVAPTF